MPVCRPISSHKEIWEVRSSLPKGRIARVLFCIADGQMVLLHGFVKKSQKTPKPGLDLAVRRMKEVNCAIVASMTSSRCPPALDGASQEAIDEMGMVRV